MDFHEKIMPVERSGIFRLDDYYVWCGTMAKGDDDKYYLYYSYWAKELGMDAWVTHSSVGIAVSDTPYGGFTPAGDALRGSGIDGSFDRDCIHNPTMLQLNGKYYLYYMANYGNGEYWDHRNHQRIGVAWADSPLGPFNRSVKPVLDVTPDSFDSLMTSNPTVTVGRDGKIVMVYKGVRDNGIMPKGGAVICGVAMADDPLGEFKKFPDPIMTNPENDWSVEDPYIWFQDDMYWALVKDFQGYFTGSQKGSVALFTSRDGVNWHVDERHPLAFNREVTWADGTTIPVKNLERPQLWRDDCGVPCVLMCACDLGDGSLPFNIQIPIKW